MGFWNGWVDRTEEGKFTQWPTPDGRFPWGKKILGRGDYAPWSVAALGTLLVNFNFKTLFC